MPQSVLIVGCGCAGPTLATFLLLAPESDPAKLPHITIVERTPALLSAGQNIDVRGTGIEIIRKLGLEDKVRSSTTGEEGVLIVDDSNETWAVNAADKTGKVQTGTSDCEILRGTLAAILYQRSQQISDDVRLQGGQGIEYIFGDSIDALEQQGDTVNVRFANSGEHRNFDIVVGADGLQSRTRRLAFGIEDDKDKLKPLNAYAAFFSMPAAPSDSLWRRWWHGPNRRSAMIRPSGDCRKSTALMIVVSEVDQRLKDVFGHGARGTEQQKALLREYFDHGEWECDRLCREMDQADDFYYDVVAQVRLEKWHKGRVVLLGDAGYCASPFSGMGTTLALNGAYSLAGALVQSPNDVDAAFQTYETSMRPLVEKAQKLAPGMPGLLHPESASGVWILKCIARAIFLSRIAILFAMIFGPPANVVKITEYGFKEPEGKGR
ncbi:putative oxidoreductase [Hortaea werneckii]|nr:putative oxidoreductase [Hortaea werneckii]KAI7070913.1 putative oxidoreductase [Hortaea werneckii]KAI7224525.1 putative oxidoreductase [Hortaea werneckii]KAI7300165.1 putative oxidoreductase [Hortaea werneckii]KAI7389113.1 putative oxidoreductase [Hortaea werneckii]